MKEERERIEAKHTELRERQTRGAYADVEDDDADPNYARIHNFRERDAATSSSSAQPHIPQSPPYGATHHHHHHAHVRTPSPQRPPAFPGHGGEPGGAPPDGDPLDGLYAKVNKPRAPGAASPPVPPAGNDSGVDRIQQLRREYQQARREGMAPAYEELDPRRRGPENDTHRMPGRGTDHRIAPRYEEVERQYASLPRRGPLDAAEYPMQPWSGHYPGAPPQQPSLQGYPPPGAPPQQPSQGYPPPGAPPQQPSQGYPPPGAPPQQPSQGYPPPGAPPQQPSQGYPPPGAPPQQPSQGYPPPGAPLYPNGQPGPPYPGYAHSQPYARPVDHRGVDPGYYPHPSPHQQPQQPQQRGPLRQDVPPSPTPPLRGPRYDTMTRGAGGGGGYRYPGEPSAEWYGYMGEGGPPHHQSNPRHKTSPTAAV